LHHSFELVDMCLKSNGCPVGLWDVCLRTLGTTNVKLVGFFVYQELMSRPCIVKVLNEVYFPLQEVGKAWFIESLLKRYSCA